MSKELKNYEKFKKKVSSNLGANGKGKLTPHKKLIKQMIDDDLSLKNMKEFLKQEFDLEVSINSLFIFCKKIKDEKIIKMELVK